MGATPRRRLAMVFTQAGACALLGTGLGIDLCGIASRLAVMAGFPFRMMWFTPLLGGVMVLLKRRGRGAQCPSGIETATGRRLRGALTGCRKRRTLIQGGGA